MKLWSNWPNLRLRVAFPSLIKALIGLVKALIGLVKAFPGAIKALIGSGKTLIGLVKDLIGLVKAFPRLGKALVLLLATSFFLSIHLLPYSPRTTNHLEQVWKPFKKLYEFVPLSLFVEEAAIQTFLSLSVISNQWLQKFEML